MLPGRLYSALVRLNPHIPELALKAGVPVQYRTLSGEVKHDIVRAVDFTSPKNNDLAAVNQLTVL